MQVLQIILIVIVSYLFIAFVLLWFVIPFMGFRKYRLPAQLPLSMLEEIGRLER